MPDWSEGSVFVIVGLESQDKELLLEGFKLIHEDGHKLSPWLISILHERLKTAKVIDSHEPESEEQVLECIPLCIRNLENTIEDSRIVEAFLTDISNDHH
jgi:hypothetical protein|tara:strand:+ start:716 stop:1015 length:300 start_codon:yes stop_codon:yes gene_type:complete